MAHRLLPFRQYDENDVVNMFALNADGCAKDLQLTKPGEDDINADGVLVSVQAGNLTENDVIDVSEDARFMNNYGSPVGRNPYPTNPLKVAPAASGALPLGVTLNQTLTNDENGESLLFNPVKKDELQAVLSGQTVPVLTRGIVTVSSAAINSDGVPSVGDAVASAGDGKFVKYRNSSTESAIGTVLATGYRGLGNDNQARYPDFQSGAYYVVKLDC